MTFVLFVAVNNEIQVLTSLYCLDGHSKFYENRSFQALLREHLRKHKDSACRSIIISHLQAELLI